MNYAFKRTIAISFTCLITVMLNLIWVPTTMAAEDYQVAAKAAYAVEFGSGKILFDQNGQEVLPIASMTKLVTAYLILEAEKTGELSWEDPVKISSHVQAISQDMSLSNVLLSTEGKYSVKELFDAMLIASANGAAMALAEADAGSESAFVDKMREKVKSWGIEDAYLVNASGLNNDCLQGQYYPGTAETDENMMSAKSMATVAWHLLKDYPEVLEIASLPSKTFMEGSGDARQMLNWNWMLPTFDTYKEGVDGLKTGTTDLAGACFTGTINLNGWRMITVVMNTENGAENPALRFTETGALMDHVYASWKQDVVLKKGSALSVKKQLPVSKGKQEEVPLVLGQDVNLWLRNDMNPSDLAIKFNVDSGMLNDKNALIAPIKKGVEVGSVTVNLKDDALGYLGTPDKQTYPVNTGAAVEKANIFALAGRSIKNFFTNLF